MIAQPMVRLAQTMHLSCTDTNTVSKWKEVTFHLTHVALEFHRVRPKWLPSLWCIWHKLCTYLASDTNTVFKWKEVIFHMTHVTLEFHRVRPKWLPSLWYIWHKLCTYLATTLTLSPNENRCVVYARCTTGLEIVLDAPDDTTRWRGSSGSSF
jgi:hypothetical protein